MPVEDSKGELVGLITSRLILRHYARRHQPTEQPPATTVKEIMVEKPTTVKPETPILEAMNTMRTQRIGCLPVVKGKELVGIVTEMDLLRVTSRLLERP